MEQIEQNNSKKQKMENLYVNVKVSDKHNLMTCVDYLFDLIDPLSGQIYVAHVCRFCGDCDYDSDYNCCFYEHYKNSVNTVCNRLISLLPNILYRNVPRGNIETVEKDKTLIMIRYKIDNNTTHHLFINVDYGDTRNLKWCDMHTNTLSATILTNPTQQELVEYRDKVVNYKDQL
jgi:hypothetical protein